MTRRLQWIAITTLSALLATGAFVVLADGSESPSSHYAQGSSKLSGASKHLVGEASPSQRRVYSNFSILRSPPEHLPKPASMATSSIPIQIDMDLSQRLTAAPYPVWLVPGQRALCLVGAHDGEISTVCTSLKQVLLNGIYMASISEPFGSAVAARRIVIGVVPDRATTVRVTPSPGVGSSTVVENTFVATDSTPRIPEALKLMGSSTGNGPR